MSHPKTRWAANLLLLGLGCGVGVVIAEIAVRSFAPQAVLLWQPGPFVQDAGQGGGSDKPAAPAARAPGSGRASPHTVPPGAGSIQAEIHYSAKYRPLVSSPESHIEPVIRDLERCGLLRESDRILHRNAAVVPYANVIFDLERPAALATVLAYLDEIGIKTAGRYGRWGYHWTDESFLSGEEAAQEVLDRRG